MTKTNSIIWGIHAGRTGDADDLFLKHNVIALGWKDAGDISKLAWLSQWQLITCWFNGMDFTLILMVSFTFLLLTSVYEVAPLVI